MKRRVRARPLAEVDVENAASWYEGERQGLGEEFVADLDDITVRIGENAAQFPIVSGPVRRALLKRFPYGVFFIEDGDVAVILAVLHLHRGPDELLRRSQTSE